MVDQKLYCQACGAPNREQALFCGHCGKPLQEEKASTVEASEAQAVFSTSMYHYTSTYHTARATAKLISAAGWIVTAISALLSLVAISESGGARLLLLPSLVGALGGLLLVGTGQFTRAAVDTADHTGEMLAIMKTTQLPKQ